MGSRGAQRLEGLSAEIREELPDPEPIPPPDGFSVRVARPFIAQGAKERVVKAIDDGLISSATSVVLEFENELCRVYGVPFAKACSSGFSALLTALRLANVGEGHDVLVPSFTMVAVLNAVLGLKANPVFVDCAPGELNPSVDQYEEKLTDKTAALIVTHTYGVPADAEALKTFCSGRNIVLIEDIAEAIGTDIGGKMVGTFGDFACASLYANKVITSGDGGFILSTCHNEREMKERANSYVNHGFTDHYHFVHLEECGNHKMSGLQAALVTPALAQLPKVMDDRSRIGAKYRSELVTIPQLTPMPVNKLGKDTPWVFGVLTDSKSTRKRLRQILADAGYETRDYFLPLHLQPLYRARRGERISLPNSENLGKRGFYLPTFYGMTDTLIQDICKCLRDAF